MEFCASQNVTPPYLLHTAELADAKDDSNQDSAKRLTRNLNEKKRRQYFNSKLKELATIIKCDYKSTDKVSVLKQAIHFLSSNKAITQNALYSEFIKPPILTDYDYHWLVLNSYFATLLAFSSAGKVTYINTDACSVFGVKTKQLIGASFFDLLHVSQRQWAKQWLNDQLLHCSNSQSGSKHLVMSCSIDQPGCEQILLEVSGFFQDSLSVSDTMVISTLAKPLSYPDSMLTMDTISSVPVDSFTLQLSDQWFVTSTSETMTLFLGYGLLDLIGTSFFDYVHYLDLPGVAQNCVSLKTSKRLTIPRHRIRTKCGLFVWLSATVVLIEDSMTFGNLFYKYSASLINGGTPSVADNDCHVELPSQTMISPLTDVCSNDTVDNSLTVAEIQQDAQLCLRYSTLSACLKRCQDDLCAIGNKLFKPSSSDFDSNS